MRRDKPLLARGRVRVASIVKAFPSPQAYADRQPGGYSLSGAYLTCRGWHGDDEADESVRFPSLSHLADQLARDNHLLQQPARGLVVQHENMQKTLLADAFAEAIQWAEDRGDIRRASRLLDAALFLARKQTCPGSPPLRILEHALADRLIEAGEDHEES